MPRRVCGGVHAVPGTPRTGAENQGDYSAVSITPPLGGGGGGLLLGSSHLLHLWDRWMSYIITRSLCKIILFRTTIKEPDPASRSNRENISHWSRLNSIQLLRRPVDRNGHQIPRRRVNGSKKYSSGIQIRSSSWSPVVVNLWTDGCSPGITAGPPDGWRSLLAGE